MKKETRRQFMKKSAIAGMGFLVAAGNSRERVRASALQGIAVAGVGVGGKGSGDIDQAGYFGHVVAVCDVDHRRVDAKGKAFPSAKKFYDYRDLFDKMGDKIDACTISTTDHMHAIITATAMKLGKHVYTQKPLTRTVYEARRMAELAKETGVCTQMGNQGSASNAGRFYSAQLDAGVIGQVREIHISTDRPIWPQGPGLVMTMEKYAAKMKKDDPANAEKNIAAMKAKIDEGLKNLEWDLWLGVAPKREFWPGLYHSFVWRGWWEYGTGALGDIACHACNMAFKGIGLRNPTSCVATTSGHDFITYPQKSVVEIHFPASKTHGPVKFVWYDGKTPIPKEVYSKYGFGGAGSLVIGEKGAASGSDFRELGGKKIPALSDEKAPYPRAAECQEHADEDSRHKREWFNAMEEGKPEKCWSNFIDNAGPLTEAVLFGNLAVWCASKADVKGETVEWDPVKMQITNLSQIKTPGVANLIQPVFREGYKMI